MFNPESQLVIHYLVETNADNAFDVELVCLAKSGSNPTITWYRSDDGANFYPVSPSSNIDIIESMPNIYRTRSELKVRSLTSATNATFACEAMDVVGSRGSLSKTIIVSKGNECVMHFAKTLSNSVGSRRLGIINNRLF